MIAAKAMDPVVGIDIHIIQPPGPVPPLPVPHPFVGMIFDPMDFAPIIGATVLVNGMPRATAGTGAKCIPPHIPIGGMFVKPPGNEGDVFMGSATVLADGDPLSRLGMPVLTCHDVGMIAPPRLKKKRKPTSLELPTSVLMAVSAGAAVIVGGPPTISMMALGMKAGMAALGKGFKKLARSKVGKKVRSKFKRKAKAQNTSCGMPGEPIDPVTGHVVNEFVDYAHPDAPALTWARFYDSGRCDVDGPLGRGFRHAYQRDLRLLGSRAIYTAPDGRELEFARDPASGAYADTNEGYELTQADDGSLLVLAHPLAGEMTFRRAHALDPAPRLAGLRRGRTRSTFHYDERGRLAAIDQQSGRGRARTYLRYDDHDHVVEVWRRAEGMLEDAAWTPVVRYAYDGRGCLIAWWDALQHLASYDYDDARRMVRLTDRNGFRFFWRYDADGRCVEAAGEDGVWRVALQYEPGRTLVTEADGGLWIHEYDELGTIRRIVDPYGGVTTRVTDDAGLVVEVVDPAGQSMAWLHDASGFHTGRMDRFGNEFPPEDEDPDPPDPFAPDLPDTPQEREWGPHAVWPRAGPPSRLPPHVAALATPAAHLDAHAWGSARREVDERGMVVAVTDAAGRTERFAYDGEGYLSAYRDRDGRDHVYGRASWRSRGSATDPQGNTTWFAYTPREELGRVVDAGGNESAYVYDYKDRLAQVIRDGVVRETYAYDLGDRLVEKRDGAGRPLLTYEVGENGRYARRLLASGEVHTYAYDERGDVTEASTRGAQVVLGRDDLRRPTLDQRDGRGVRHVYAEHGLASTVYLDRFEVRYVLAPDGALRIVTPPQDVHAVWAVDAGLVLRELANGTRELSEYDVDGRCRGRAAWRHGERPAERWTRYEYTPEGELRRAVDPSGAATEWEYDAAHRLIAERRPDRDARVVRYDPAGNVVARPGHAELRPGPGNRLVAAAAETFRYDDRNHLAERLASDGRRTTYAYDSLDMLVRVTTTGKPDCVFEYDGLCRRVAKQVGDARTEYYWDADRPAAEIAPDGRVRLYVYVNERALVPLLFVDYDSLDAEPASGRAYHVFHDQVGVPVRIEDARGATVWRATHVDPYGEVAVASGSTIAYHLRFPGHYLDVETGLHYNRFRYYSPALARYLQSDPYGQAGGINLYAYPANPLVDVDVLGLHSKSTKKTKTSGDTETPAARKQREALAKMSDEELQEYCRKRAQQISAQLPEESARRTTITVTVVQKKGKPHTRRVVVTASTNNGKLPKNKQGENVRLKPGEKNEPAGVQLGRRDTGKVDADGNPVRETYDKSNNRRYRKRTRDQRGGRSDHHGEQRAQAATGPDEEIAGMSHNRAKCCPGCTKALGDDIDKVPVDQHAGSCRCPACD